MDDPGGGKGGDKGFAERLAQNATATAINRIAVPALLALLAWGGNKVWDKMESLDRDLNDVSRQLIDVSSQVRAVDAAAYAAASKIDRVDSRLIDLDARLTRAEDRQR